VVPLWKRRTSLLLVGGMVFRSSCVLNEKISSDCCISAVKGVFCETGVHGSSTSLVMIERPAREMDQGAVLRRASFSGE
jgi:hypothetical protein